MAGELIRLDNKHISVEQMKMSIDRVLQCYIRNMSGPPSPLIENYLWEASFWHVATIGRGCKLNPKLISVLIERWRPETHTFHFPCGECTITLEDVHLAVGEFSWGSAVLAILYREICRVMRLNKAKIGGCLSLLQSWARFHFPFLCHRVDHPYTFLLITRWNRSASYVGLPVSLEDIRFLLDQRSKAQFQWTPYEDPAIRAVILDEYFQNSNIWHVKVPLVNYAIVEMHQSDRVLQQFGFRQPIPVAPEVLDDEHEIDLRQLHTDWPGYWSTYIEMWKNQYDYIPTREPIIVPELACVPKYMPWFRIHGKPYLLLEDERRREIHVERE
ncbi:hypothetical protein CXB51_017141 [Gossypium anomalum]|uniref:Aminotransferase-like plant mobile domain-containing protein n=1 Tax=Gossypium anomalum TaxID=47600 RepID=A0A8J5Z5B1_9ROSI|nr:hypothetical protein CXB51_017141 [Gossypium anomalum]